MLMAGVDFGVAESTSNFPFAGWVTCSEIKSSPA